MTTKAIIADFLKLQNAYSFTKRTLVTAERYVNIAQKGLVGIKDYENPILQESLVEHIGHLPILASYLYPYIQNKEKVNLGRALIMLSIHDIGETVTGEVFAYKKTQKEEDEEYEAALKKLHPDLHLYMQEFEANETLDAKYAKSIDILAPNIHEMDMPKITLERFKGLGASLDDIVNRKRKHLEWDSFLLEVFDILMDQYRSVEEGREQVFPSEAYDII